ncbi:hypothetical protein [Vibrio crassostreae]|uniref:hypothetical protein n=1 Tax=Vibrio crassostreae TaxID=246167 RepID=UPI002E184BD3|nr:hypothetical protein [Vibrio crassostreae]
MFEYNGIIKRFVDNFKGAGSITSLGKGNVVYSNQAYNKISHYYSSTKEVLQRLDSDEKYQNMDFHDYVEQQLKKTNQPIFKFKIHNVMYFITIRILVLYNYKPATLTLVNKVKVPLENLANDIYTTPISKYIHDYAPFAQDYNCIEKKTLSKFLQETSMVSLLSKMLEKMLYYINSSYMHFLKKLKTSKYLLYFNYISAVFNQNFQITPAIEKFEFKDDVFITIRILIE